MKGLSCIIIILVMICCTSCVQNNYSVHNSADEHNKGDSKFTEEDSVVRSIMNKMQDIDYTIIDMPINISIEENLQYKNAYLNILKSEIIGEDTNGEIVYFKDLYKLGADFDNLSDLNLHYYNDLDGDGLPELLVYLVDEAITTLTVYSYYETVYKLGDYSDAKLAVSNLRFSENYPGLFNEWWG